MAIWRSGDAADRKFVNSGSIPGIASKCGQETIRKYIDNQGKIVGGNFSQI